MNNQKMFVSIIVCTNNSEKTIYDCLDSIKKQTYSNFEVVIIDNISSDNTIKIIKSFEFKKIKIIIEKDKGIYEAINKGILNSSGNLVSILHSDDLFYEDDVLEKIVNSFETKKVDIVYGNLIYVKKNDIYSTLRMWKPGKFIINCFSKGWSPPHPAFIIKKKLYDENNLYDQSIGNSADIELMHRFLEIKKYDFFYLDKILVRMRYGGKSNRNLFVIINQNFQIIKFLKIDKNFFKILIFIIYKLFDRLKQFLVK